MKTLILVVLLCCTSCFIGRGGSTTKEESTLISKDKLISFEIRLRNADSMNTSKNQAVLTLTNVSQSAIRVMRPTHGWSVYPFMSDEKGNQLMILFTAKLDIFSIEYVGLDPGQQVESVYGFDIDNCYDYTSKGSYDLWFEYYGQVFDSADIEISDSISIKSNIIEIITK